MKYSSYFHLLSMSLLIQGCDNNVKIKTVISRNIASDFSQKTDGNESLSKGIKEFLNNEQNFHNKNLWREKNIISPLVDTYAPEANPKFPLPYYLIPEPDIKRLYSSSSNAKIEDQLYMLISGTKYFKLFVHPESVSRYSFLSNAYRYIGMTETEFMASPTSSTHSLVVWNQKNKEKIPFIAKVSLDKNAIENSPPLLSSNEVKRSIATQKVFDKIGKDNLDKMNIKIFPEMTGFIFNEIGDNSSRKLGGQLIREIPSEIANGNKKWFSFSTLMSPNYNPKPLIMEVIKQSGLNSYDFFEKYMINSYLEMFEQVSLRNGINFEPQSQNLILETNLDLKPTGIWILRDFGEITINLESGKIKRGRSSYVASYAFFYKKNIFDKLLKTVAKLDLTLTEDKILELNKKIDHVYLNKINAYLKLNLKELPDLSTYKKIEEIILEQTIFDHKTKRMPLRNSDELKAFFERKKSSQEWIKLSNNPFGSSEFFATDHGVYEISNNKIVGVALFNKNDMKGHKENHNLLDDILKFFSYKPRTGCFKMIQNFFR